MELFELGLYGQSRLGTNNGGCVHLNALGYVSLGNEDPQNSSGRSIAIRNARHVRSLHPFPVSGQF